MKFVRVLLEIDVHAVENLGEAEAHVLDLIQETLEHDNQVERYEVLEAAVLQEG